MTHAKLHRVVARATLGVVARATLVVAALAALGIAGLAAAAEKELRWARYDVDLEVRSDGTLAVRETQELAFTKGSFTWGRREIAGDGLESIDGIAVTDGDGTPYREAASGGGPHTFRVERSGRDVHVRYEFPAARAGTRRTVVVAYVVHGAVRRYQGGGVDQLFWKAIPRGNPFPTDAGRVTLRLPEGVTLVRARAHGAPTVSVEAPGSAATFDLRTVVRPGSEVEVVAEWPLNAVAGGVPAWQERADRADTRRREARRPVSEPPAASPGVALANLLLLAAGVLVGVGGVLGSILAWHARGRDPAVARIAAVLREPPSDLPPAVAGTLVDERADVREIVATILDLARRGHVAIRELRKDGLIFDSTDHEIERTTGGDAPSAFEAAVLSALFEGGDRHRLSALATKLADRVPALTRSLDEEVVRRGFFPAAPGRVRKRWGLAGLAVLALGFAGFFPAAAVAGATPLAGLLAIPAGLVVAGLALAAVAPIMPRRTRAGGEAAARWKAFREWLRSASAFPDHPRAADLFDRHLPHAVALGVESSWIARFRRVHGDAPLWWTGIGTDGSPRAEGPPRAASGGGAGGTPVAPGSGGGNPSLAGGATAVGSSLASVSKGLGAMLSSASAAFAAPSSSGNGGGFSGGGGSSGSGSGGGGSSFG